jgi:aspartate carbamoyltransferase catalytic subunit
VELAADVIDGPQAVITAQVEAGIVVRMAVLYELVAGAPAAAGPTGDPLAAEPPSAEPAVPAKAPA